MIDFGKAREALAMLEEAVKGPHLATSERDLAAYIVDEIEDIREELDDEEG